MRTSDFDYFLPPSCIAAYPAAERDGSRLLRLDRHHGRLAHLRFADIAEHLPPRALIVLNDTRVIPARLRSHKSTGGAVELLLVRRAEKDVEGPEPEQEQEQRQGQKDDGAAPGPTSELWHALGRGLGRSPVGSTLSFRGGLSAEVLARDQDGLLTVVLRPGDGRAVSAVLDEVGEPPLPPYIEGARKAIVDSGARGHTDASSPEHDKDRYQTVYAASPGAVAAPTAGLHFTRELLAQLQARGHAVVHLTLHVGPGTFRAVKVDEVDDHRMDAEWYTIPPATADAVGQARRAGRPILAVGTTVVRALESAARASADGDTTVRPGTAWSRLFLRPGDTFHVVTDLVTNFHLPRSTLLMLVSAFAGRERVLSAYAEAVAAGYRFYSYGDAMLIRGTS